MERFAPRSTPLFATLLALHILATVFQAPSATVAWMMAILARLRFDANEWQTVLITMAPPTAALTSIFWGELLQRWPLRRYLALFCTVGLLPIAAIGWAQSYWHLLLCHVLVSIGTAAWTPVYGRLLRQFYPDALRGRALATMNVTLLAAGMPAAYVFGHWLRADEEAFRIFLPTAAGLHVLSILIVIWMDRLTAARATAPQRHPWTGVLAPIWRMGAVLRADRRFYRYELAFMTYGTGFMICDALLPMLLTDKLGMDYAQVAESTRIAFNVGMLAMALPMGWVLDRLGPARTSALSFGWLVLYPLLLIVAGNPRHVGAASVVFGMAMAGVQLGWMLGPVVLAGDPRRVPEYMAIHTSLVGLRGILFQGIGMLLYVVTGSFVWPLLIAAAGFGWATLQMLRLHALLRGAPPTPAAPVLAPGPLAEEQG